MANLGNAWHIPTNPQPRGRAGMRDPVGAVVPGTAITIFSGNQFQGAGNPGNQLQDGSSIFFRRQGDANWTPVAMLFQSVAGNDNFYSATIPEAAFAAGDVVRYYLRIAYDDHATTFLRANGAVSTATADEAQARAQPFTFTVESNATRGRWGKVIDLPNAAIHAHVLPNGHLLIWGRRERPDQTLNEHSCTPFVWDPAKGKDGATFTNQPRSADGKTINLFCSGHTFLPDGRLLVVGGHLFDSEGIDQATIFDPADNSWTPTAPMNNGRWYPTATSMPDGSVLVLSGAIKPNVIDAVPQVWRNGTWLDVSGLPLGQSFQLYPRMHVASNGLVFMTGTQAITWSLDVSNGGQWRQVALRGKGQRDYCPSVMYAQDKVIYIGGGNDPGSQAPTADSETIDLSAAAPQWRPTSPMHFRRRHHNGTVLPDGTVLVTGGTRGGGPPSMGFNDLAPGQPVHIAELWDPVTRNWTELAAEQIDRCYHSTAVLLPDATVVSAGGGEYLPFPGSNQPNDPQDSHRDAQIFSPPYLFKGPRPVINSAPASVGYGTQFDVGASAPASIKTVSLVRLSSATHAFNMSQHINFLPFTVAGDKLKVTSPASPNVCPPGHYMLFILSNEGVPSIAKIVQVVPSASAAAGAAPQLATAILSATPAAEGEIFMDAAGYREAVLAAAHGTAVLVGITGTCPYGIGACWGGASEALRNLDGVRSVDPIPNADDSTANIFLEDDRLPALEQWDEEFRGMVNGSYVLRGVEVTLAGRIVARDGDLFLAAQGRRPAVQLGPLIPADKVQWDSGAAAPKPLGPTETGAYERLAGQAGVLAGDRSVTVTGPLQEGDSGYRLEVRLFML